MSFAIEDGFAQQLESVRQRLAALRDLLETQSDIDPALQQQIVAELQAALDILQATQVALRQNAARSAGTARSELASELTPVDAAQAQQVERLQASLQQKEMLLREIHHRVKNNLQIVSSLLDIQALRSLDPTVQTLLRNNQSRINSIALVHERLSQSSDLTEITLGEYVQSMTTTLVRTYAIDINQVRLRTDIQTDALISPDRAIPIGLILNELISNALKHGLQNREGEIVVQLVANSPESVTLTVSNTGNPLPEDFNPNAGSSLGFQLINSLVQQINGTLEIEQAESTRFCVRFNVVGNE